NYGLFIVFCRLFSQLPDEDVLHSLLLFRAELLAVENVVTCSDPPVTIIEGAVLSNNGRLTHTVDGDVSGKLYYPKLVSPVFLWDARKIHLAQHDVEEFLRPRCSRVPLSELSEVNIKTLVLGPELDVGGLDEARLHVYSLAVKDGDRVDR